MVWFRAAVSVVVLVPMVVAGCWYESPRKDYRAQPVQRALVLSFLGDIMAHRPNYEMDDYARIYQGVSDILRSDSLTFANLETPVDVERPYATWPRFSVRPPYVEAAVAGGVDFFSLANNHSNDWGAEGAVRTLRAMERVRLETLAGGRGIYYGGMSASVDSGYTIVDIWRHGWRLGVITLTHFLNDPNAGAGHVQRVDYENPQQVRELLAFIAVHRASYDILIVSYHGGREYRVAPHPPKRQFFRQLAEAGVDIVWGHHPHVLQPWEVVSTAAGARAMVVYSLGNFVSGQTWFVGAEDAALPRAFTGDSLVLQVEYGVQNGAPYLQKIEAIPISHWKDPDGGVEVRRLHALRSAEDVGGRWRAYYHSRHEILTETFGVRRRVVFPPAWVRY